MTHVTRSNYTGGIQVAKRTRPTVRSSAHLPAGDTAKLCKRMKAALSGYRAATRQSHQIAALHPIRELSKRGGLLARALRGDHLSIAHADLIHRLCVQACSEAIVGQCIDDNGKGHTYATHLGTAAFDKLVDAVTELAEAHARQSYWLTHSQPVQR